MAWLRRHNLEALIDSGLALGGEWMTLEGDFDGNELFVIGLSARSMTLGKVMIH
jgi:hypothetical protein